MEQSEFDHIKKLIIAGDIEEAISVLKTAIKNYISDYEVTLNVIEAQVKQLKDNFLVGRIKDEEYQRARNDINYRIFELIKQVFRHLNENDSSLRKKRTKTPDPISRQEMLGIFSKDLWDARAYGIIRQRAAFSSFAIPNRAPTDFIWKERDGDEPRLFNHYESSWSERKWLEAHAISTYCKLIIKPSIAREIAVNRGRKAAILRLKCLRDFLVSNNDKIDVITTDSLGENIIIVGNWFFSKSDKPTDKGWEDTAFEWDKLLVENQIEQFDLEFQSLLLAKGMDIYDSKFETLEQIEKLIREI